MDEPEYHDILLKEYAEAGSLCRNCEQLIRTSISVSLPLISALTGLLLSDFLDGLQKFGLSVAGVLVSLIFLNTIHREKAYYACYLKRTKKIEELITRDDKPVMSLYTDGASATAHSRTFSNKLALATVLWLAFLYFMISTVIHGCAAYRGVVL